MNFFERLCQLHDLLYSKGFKEEASLLQKSAHYVPDDVPGVPSFWRHNHDYGEGFYYGDMSEKPGVKEWREKNKGKGSNMPKKKKKEAKKKGPKKKGPKFETLQKNKVPLTDEERKKAMDAGCIWHHGPNHKETCAIWKAEVDGKMWYVCNTHRAMQSRTTLSGAIRAFDFIKTTA